MKSRATSDSDRHGDTTATQADPRVVQQLMFNRILSSVRLLAIDGVTIAGLDAKAGTFVGGLAGVSFVVNVRQAPNRAEPLGVPYRGGKEERHVL